MKKYLYIVFWLIFIDAITKYIAENFLSSEITLIPSLLTLEYVQNIWIAFSIPLTGIALKIITVILISWIFLYYWKHEKHRTSPILHSAYSLIFAGAIGNAWERIFRSYVTDFISIEHFAVFNLADSFICIWALLLIYFYIIDTP